MGLLVKSQSLLDLNGFLFVEGIVDIVLDDAIIDRKRYLEVEVLQQCEDYVVVHFWLGRGVAKRLKESGFYLLDALD